MTYDDDDQRDRDLDAWLRQPVERIAPPAGSWERVARGARRRKWAKAVAGTAAGVVVIAGAVPAVIAVRHDSNNQKLLGPTATGKASPSVTGVPTTSGLSGFVPLSISFVHSDTLADGADGEEAIGYAWGTLPGSTTGVVAKTTDDGQTWTKLPSPPVAAVQNSQTGDGQIRMLTGEIGYVFGPQLYVTRDRGLHWHKLPTPGYIDDIEAVHKHAWALVRPDGQASQTVKLYQSNEYDQALKPIGAVSGTAVPGADAIAVNGFGTKKRPQDTTTVLIGTDSLWQARNGANWAQLSSPCPTTDGDAQLQDALLASTGTSSLAAACGYARVGHSERKLVYTSSNPRKLWTATKGEPTDVGYLQTLTIGDGSDIIIGCSYGGAQRSANDGRSWQPFLADDTVRLGFVGFVDTGQIVALQDPTVPGVGAFAMTLDGGEGWRTVYQFK